MDNKKITGILNAILEHELAGVVRYTHYSFMIFGHARIPIVKWQQEQANESLMHAQQIGEYVTALGEHPSLKISSLLETHKHNIDDIMKESLEHETKQLGLYEDLLKEVDGKHIPLEEYAREMIREEQDHIFEVQKMLKKSL